MLRNISIQNYRLFSRFEVNDIADVNLFVGTNNCGKTSFLEAVHLLRSQGNPGALAEIARARGDSPRRIPIGSVSSNIGHPISSVFFGYSFPEGEEQFIRIRSEEEEMSVTIGLKPLYDQLPLFSADEMQERELTAELSGLEQESVNPIGHLTFDYSHTRSRARQILVYENGLAVFGYNVMRNFSNSIYLSTSDMRTEKLFSLWDKITLTPKEEALIQALKILEPKVERINFTGGRGSVGGILIKLSNYDKPIPLSSLGDGMRRILSIAASAVSAENGVVLIDEIDTGLYYKAITALWRLLLGVSRDFSVQIFATTHSWDCVRAYQEALETYNNEYSAKLWRLENKPGGTKITTYSPHELGIAISQDIEVR